MAASSSTFPASTLLLLRRSTIFYRRTPSLSLLPRGGRAQVSTASQSTSSSDHDDHGGPSTSSSSSSSSRLPFPSLPPSASNLLTGSKLSPSRLKPITPTFYTARPTYITLLLQLEELTRKSKRALERLHVLKGNAPVPSLLEVGELLGRRAIGSNAPAPIPAVFWLKDREMNGTLGITLQTSQYRKITAALSTLSRYAPLVKAHLPSSPDPEDHQLVTEVHDLLQSMRRDAVIDEEESTLVMTPGSGVDAKGRIWANGRRKEATAMVWIAPLESSDADGSNALPLGQVMVNGFSMSKYFLTTKHRENIVHPLRLVNLLGSFNVFAIASGGGHTGQSGAIAHGLAKCLLRFFEEKFSNAIEAVEHATTEVAKAEIAIEIEDDEISRARSQLMKREKEQEEWLRLKDSVREVLLKDGVLKRDPRMVERKKTGLAKARKAYTWVKR